MGNKLDQYPLSGRIERLTGKPKSELTREDLLNIIESEGIERITFHYTSSDGKIKELRIPATSRSQAETILAEGERVDGSSLFKGIIDPGNSDLYVVPVYKSVFINPFDNKSLNFMCRFLDSKGELANFAPDNILKNAHDNLKKKTGYEHYALGELEFYLIGDFRRDLYPPAKQRGYHGSAPFVKSGDIVNEMLYYIMQITPDIKYAHNEVGYIDSMQSEFPSLKDKSAEQVEIEFMLTDVETAADNMILASWVVRNVAFRNGYTATFFPKIDIGHAGSGLHFHNALYMDGKNIMTEKDGSLSTAAMQMIGGICHYANSLNAFGNMVSSSYLRLVPHQEAPTKVCWSQSNRSALVRVPLGWTDVDNLAMRLNPQQKEKLVLNESRQTAELRSPDGSANVHLLLAGLCVAIEWGLTNPDSSLTTAKNCHAIGNIHSNPAYDKLDELATSCVESAEILLQHRSLFERDGIFPPSVIDYVAEILNKENDRNLNKRLMALPEEEKIAESRRIMHRNLFKH